MKSNPLTVLLMALIILVLLFFFMKKTPAAVPSQIPEGVACTMDAKLCPDGSSVGRSGPNCEFDPCP